MTSGQILRRLHPISYLVIALGFIWMCVAAWNGIEKHVFIGLSIALGGIMTNITSYLFGFDTPLDGFDYNEWQRHHKNIRY